jgi:outer membrane protein OmpA-like peptidoglycan-associated protein
MENRSRRRVIVAFGMLAAAGIVMSVFDAPAFAQAQPSEAQILDALKPRPKTRSLSRSLGDPQAAQERRFIDELRLMPKTRSLTVEQREQVAEIARNRPHIDLEINFEFNSDKVTTAAVPVLVSLGRALSADELKGAVFLINGHTDAKGSADYNQDLSERRAEAVKRLLVEQFGLPATTLVAIGYGKTQLKNTADPFAGENRRVQIVNTEVK